MIISCFFSLSSTAGLVSSTFSALWSTPCLNEKGGNILEEGVALNRANDSRNAKSSPCARSAILRTQRDVKRTALQRGAMKQGVNDKECRKIHWSFISYHLSVIMHEVQLNFRISHRAVNKDTCWNPWNGTILHHTEIIYLLSGEDVEFAMKKLVYNISTI